MSVHPSAHNINRPTCTMKLAIHPYSSRTISPPSVCAVYICQIIGLIKSKRSGGGGRRHVTNTGEKKNAYRFLVEEPEARRPLGRIKHKWKGDMKMDVEGIA